jgi:N-acetylglucosaminyldiphosphoundecaprenol N-acetyl-beta-D-mannosaminyltransferase
MVVEAYMDPEFASVVNNAKLVATDGKPLTWALKLLYGIEQERIAGMDLLPELLSHCEKSGLKVGFYGSTEKMLERTKNYIQQKFPQLDCPLFFSPPFRSLMETEELEIIQMINQSGIHLLFVVLGCPKQEKWMARMNGKVKGVMIGIGGALPVLIGSQKRAPQWMQEYGLEWFFRLLQEPVRLFKRYALTNSLFLGLLFKEKFKSVFS